MRSTAHLTNSQIRELFFRKATSEEVAERDQANLDAAWLLRLNLLNAKREDRLPDPNN